MPCVRIAARLRLTTASPSYVWESVEEFATATASPEGRKAGEELLEDERRFIDMERSALWVAQEHPIVEG